jgi:hypothetical protein
LIARLLNNCRWDVVVRKCPIGGRVDVEAKRLGRDDEVQEAAMLVVVVRYREPLR